MAMITLSGPALAGGAIVQLTRAVSPTSAAFRVSGPASQVTIPANSNSGKLQHRHYVPATVRSPGFRCSHRHVRNIEPKCERAFHTDGIISKTSGSAESWELTSAKEWSASLLSLLFFYHIGPYHMRALNAATDQIIGDR